MRDWSPLDWVVAVVTVLSFLGMTGGMVWLALLPSCGCGCGLRSEVKTMPKGSASMTMTETADTPDAGLTVLDVIRYLNDDDTWGDR